LVSHSLIIIALTLRIALTYTIITLPYSIRNPPNNYNIAIIKL